MTYIAIATNAIGIGETAAQRLGAAKCTRIGLRIRTRTLAFRFVAFPGMARTKFGFVSVTKVVYTSSFG